MVLVKNWPFFQIFSYGNIVEEFPGIAHSSGQKLAIFPGFFFRQDRPGK